MKRHRVLTIGIAAVALFGLVPSTAVSAKSGRTFLSSVHVNADQTATFPLRHGVTTDGRDLWFVIIDASTSKAAAQRVPLPEISLRLPSEFHSSMAASSVPLVPRDIRSHPSAPTPV